MHALRDTIDRHPPSSPPFQHPTQPRKTFVLTDSSAFRLGGKIVWPRAYACLSWVLGHEQRRSKRRCVTVLEMKEGPSGSAIRSLIPSHRKLLWSKSMVLGGARQFRVYPEIRLRKVRRRDPYSFSPVIREPQKALDLQSSRLSWEIEGLDQMNNCEAYAVLI